MGSQIEVGPGAFGLAISPKGLIGVSETGFERFGVSVLEPHKDTWQQRLLWPFHPRTSGHRISLQNRPTTGRARPTASLSIPKNPFGSPKAIPASPPARRLERHPPQVVSINSGAWHNSYTADLAIDPVRHILYVLDQANDRLVLIDTLKDAVLSSVATAACRLPSPCRRTAIRHTSPTPGCFAIRSCRGHLRQTPCAPDFLPSLWIPLS